MWMIRKDNVVRRVVLNIDSLRPIRKSVLGTIAETALED